MSISRPDPPSGVPVPESQMPEEEADWVLDETLREALAESSGTENPIEELPD